MAEEKSRRLSNEFIAILITIATIIFAAGGFFEKADATDKHVDKIDLHQADQDKHLARHDVMMARIVQAMSDSHAARINTEKLLQQNQDQEGDQ